MIYRIAFLCCLLLLCACGGEGAPGLSAAGFQESPQLRADATLIGIEVSTASPLPVGVKFPLRAVGSMSDGSTRELTGDPALSWTLSSTSVAGLDRSAGLLVPRAPGTAQLTARVGSIRETVDVTVNTAQLTSLQVDPPLANLPVGVATAFTATGVFDDSSSFDLSGSVRWISTQPAVASMTVDGVLQPLAVGNTKVAAIFGTQRAERLVTVTNATLASLELSPADSTLPDGSGRQLSLTGIFSDSSTHDLSRSADWTSTDEGVAISNATGFVTAVDPGACDIQASFGGQQTMAHILVTTAELTGLRIGPALGPLPLGLTRELTVVGLYTDDSTQALSEPPLWSSSDDSVATVGVDGIVVPVAPGEVTIEVRAQGFSRSLDLTVTSAQLASLQLTGPSKLPIGFNSAFRATGTYTDGTHLDLTTDVAWSSTRPEFASVSSEGLVTGVGAGNALVQAKLGSVTTRAHCRITDATLRFLPVTPKAQNLLSGLRQQYVATGVFSDGSRLDLTERVVWASSLGSVAVIDNAPGWQGQALARESGSSLISASLLGVTGQTWLRVTPRSPLGSATFRHPEIGYLGDPTRLVVEIADLNRDGKLDLVLQGKLSSDGQPGTILRWGQGDGTFVAEGLETSAIVLPRVADVNGDGNPDLIGLSRNVRQIGCLLNQGDGTFGPPLIHTLSLDARDVVVADYSGDSRADLVVLYVSSGVRRVNGVGDGTFAGQSFLVTNDSVEQLRPAEMSGDGALDYVVTLGNEVGVILNDGQFAQGSYHEPFPDIFLTELQVADVNADGRPDVLVTTGDAREPAKLLLGQPGGALGSPSSIPLPNGLPTVWDDILGLSDLDQDGYLDIVYPGFECAYWLPGLGGGAFGPSRFLGIPRTGRLEIGDFDSDGRNDLLSSANGYYGLSNGPEVGGFFAPAALGARAGEFVLADLDGDHNIDLAALTSEGLRLYRLHGEQSPELVTVLAFAEMPPLRAGDLTVGDFNSDGRVDLVTSATSGQLQLFVNQGNWQFAAPVGVANSCSRVNCADLDLDGKLDLLTLGQFYSSGAQLRALLSDGSGTFSQSSVITGLSSIRGDCALVDVNHDRYPDVVFMLSNRQLCVALNNRDGTFAAPLSTATTGDLNSFVVADFDRDGFEDVIAHTSSVLIGNSIRDMAVGPLLFFRGLGTGEWASPVTLGQGRGVLCASDLDGDGRLDLFAGGSIWRGDGEGGFTQGEDCLPTYYAPGAQALDVTGDGLTDLVARCNYGVDAGHYQIWLLFQKVAITP